MRTLLRFAGFHRQQKPGLLRGLLHLEVCKSRSAPGIELEITTFRKSLYVSVLSFAFFFEGQKSFLWPALLVRTGHSHSILRHRPQKSSTYVTLLRARRLLLRRLGLLVSTGVHTSSDMYGHQPYFQCYKLKQTQNS